MTIQRALNETVPAPEAIVRVLEEARIDMVFGMPGGNAMMIYDALHDHRSAIRPVLVRHEHLAGVMAEVYGRLTGKPGVAMGQGAFMAANAMMGVLEAHLGSSPMLIMTDLTDNAPFSHHGPYQSATGEFGGWDAKLAFQGVTKRTMVLHEPMQAVQSTQYAIKHAMVGERGPVALLYHSTALKGSVGPDTVPRLYPTHPYLLENRIGAPEKELQEAVKTLLQAKKPVIIAGNGARISHAFDALATFAQALGAPVATTASGKGVFPETHDLALGVFGTFGLPGANALIAEADVVLVAGSKLAPTDTAFENPKLLDPERQIFIQIDIEPTHASWTYPCEHVLIGDAARVLDQLTDALSQEPELPGGDRLRNARERVKAAREAHGYFNWDVYDSNDIPLNPERVIGELNKRLAQDAIVTCDAGENRLFMTHYFQTKSAGSFISPAAIGGMGYALPAAMAAKLIHPERQVVSVSGDGGFSIVLNGMMTAKDEGIPIVNIVLNNSALGWVMHGQKDRVIASKFPQQNFAEIAKAMGCRGIRVETPEQLQSALDEVRHTDQPTLLDVITSDKHTYESVLSPLAVP